MQVRHFLALLSIAALAFVQGHSQEADSKSPGADLKALYDEVQTKLKAGQASAEELAPEIAAFDALLAKHRGKKTDDVAQILLLQAMLYGQVLNDSDKARQLLERLQREFPGTAAATMSANAIESLEKAAKVKQAQSSLVGRPAPALNFHWSSDGTLKTLADLKGKVVVLDFWATWCGPCVSSFPQMRELVAHYKDRDVVVVGVTSLQGRVIGLVPAQIDTRNDPKKELALMNDYIKAKDITWTVAFSEEPVFNPDYGIQGIPHMAIIAPDGTVRHTGLHPAMPHAAKVEKIDALLKEFGKPVADKSAKS